MVRVWGYIFGGLSLLVASNGIAQTFGESSNDYSQSQQFFEQLSKKEPKQVDVPQTEELKTKSPEAIIEKSNTPSQAESEGIDNIQKAFVSSKKNEAKAKSYDPLELMSRSQVTSANEDKSFNNNDLAKIEEDDDDFVPLDEINERLNAPTVDGSERGGQAFVMVDDKGDVKKVTNIFLFYDNFKIRHSFGSYTTCDVRFNIISNLDRKLSQFDVKLVWPDITTTLSFEDINPYSQTYYNYTLLGEGCYSMDKAPNIVVNRCRAKGLTSSECASKIIWLSK